ncbi:hypothetical protein SteCoe_5807 [Stentor coeruleus]|uniref:Uncharacterized protein n=1 Tax=Stentor coeruleus TaxID=5963 RepID=A0A1R2CRD4_9CILI|nr:hypothetical protein SteCoe_5807 [Stentor coeruleus]
MQNRVGKLTEKKSQSKAIVKEILTPSFAKTIRDDSPQSGSNYKEIQRLRIENSKLLTELASAKEELKLKEEFATVFNKFIDDKYDQRRMNMYKAKVQKQDRIIFLMQTALDAQRTLYFEMENILGGIAKLLKNTERPDQTIISIGSILKSSRKLLRDAESSSQIAYSQLLSSRKIGDLVEIDYSSFPDWKSSVKISGIEIFDLEICLSDLLGVLLTPGSPGLIGKVRDSCAKLLKLGIQLPMTNSINLEQDFFDNEAKKLILMSVKTSAKNEVKEIINKLCAERKNIRVEKDMMEKDIESKLQEINDLDKALRELKKSIDDKLTTLNINFESNLYKPFDDVWNVFKNIDQSGSAQLFIVFKMHAEKMKHFVDTFLNFRL